MLRHIVLSRWRPEATPEQRTLVRHAIEAMPGQVSEILLLQCGDNVGQGPNHSDFAVVLDFADREAFQRYAASPAHRAFAEGPGKAAVASIVCIQHVW